MEEDEERALIAEALATLAPEQLAALEEIYVHGRTLAETAERLGDPPPVVRRRIDDSLRHLRDDLAGRL